jgi:nucleoid DNA-binding protein
MNNEKDVNDFIPLVAQKTGLKRSKVVLIIKEYTFVVMRELLKGNQVEFPFGFGTAQIITKKMNAVFLNRQIRKKKEIFDYFYRTQFFVEVPSLRDYHLRMYFYGTIIEKLLYIIKNKLKVYKYVD